MGLGISIVLIAQALARRAVAMQMPHLLPCSRASAQRSERSMMRMTGVTSSRRISEEPLSRAG